MSTSSGKPYQFLFAEPRKEVIFEQFYSEAAGKRLDIVPICRKMRTKLGFDIQTRWLNRKIHFPFRRLFHAVERYDYRDDVDYYMIVPTIAVSRWEVDEIKRFKARHKNVKLILLILDSLHANSIHLPPIRREMFSDVWDLVITYDKQDAEEYGFQWFGYTYYPECEQTPACEDHSDALYIASNKKGRNALINSVYERLASGGVDCDFRLVSRKKVTEEIVSGIRIIDKKYSYPEIVAMVKNTNCIVEILMEGQATQSYRYFEALTYNKKLLTNNPNIASLPYYDERYMKRFDSVQNIDPEWVKTKEDVDYGYHGEFAQIHLLDYLERYFELT